MTKSIKAGERELFFKFSKKALINFEKKVGKKLTEELDLADTGELCLQAILIGHEIEEKTCALTIEELWKLDNKYDIIDKMMEAFTEDEKKPQASSPE